MIEALIRTRDGTLPKRKGDIIVAKPAGSAWAAEERRVHQLVEIDDPALEAELLALPEGSRVVAYPYADMTAPDEIGQVAMTVRSRVRVNVDALPADVRDPSKEVSKIRLRADALTVEAHQGDGRSRTASGTTLAVRSR